MRPIRVTTETAIPTVFQVELAEAAEGETEGVGEGEAVGFQRVTSGVVGSIDGEAVNVVDGVENTTAGLRTEDDVWLWVSGDVVDETEDEPEELAVIWLSGGNGISPRPGKEGLVVATSRRVEDVSIVVLVVGRRYKGVLLVPLTSPMSSRRCPCRFLLGASAAYRKTAAPDT